MLINKSDMEDYVTFEQAKKLKELGFDWECNHIYKKDFFNQWIFFHCLQDAYGNHNQGEKSEPIFVSAPTLSQAQKWLREVKKEHIIVCLDRWVTNKPYRFDLYQEFGEDLYGQCVMNDFQTYEEALSKGIDAALELLK